MKHLLLSLLAMTLAHGAPPKVLVTLKPLHSITAGLMKGVGTPDLLLSAQDSPHTFGLTPAMSQKIHDADLIIWVGPPLETRLTKSLKNNPGSVPLIKAIPSLPLRDDHSHEGHTHGDHAMTHDPHFWLSPGRMRKAIPAILQALVAKDPQNSALYMKNAQHMEEHLDALDQELAQKLAPLRGIPFLVYHDGYQYLEHDYHLKGLGSIVMDPNIPLSPYRLYELKRDIEEQDVHCVLSEPQFHDKIPSYLTEGSAIQVMSIDPLGIPYTPGENMYFEWLRDQISVLSTCLTEN